MWCSADGNNAGSMTEATREEMNRRLPLPRLPVSLKAASRRACFLWSDESRAKNPYPEFQYVPALSAWGGNPCPPRKVQPPSTTPSQRELRATPASMNCLWTPPHPDLHATEFEHERLTRDRCHRWSTHVTLHWASRYTATRLSGQVLGQERYILYIIIHDIVMAYLGDTRAARAAQAVPFLPVPGHRP